MADNDNSEAQAANEAELAKWEGDFTEEQLDVPYKREQKGADDTEAEVDNTEDSGEADTESDTEDTEAEEPAESVVEPVVTAEDPGEYKAADYSFEVKLADGKTHKISSVEEAEALAEDADNFETPAQLLAFIRKTEKMERNQERDYEKWQDKHKTFTEQLEQETARREQTDSFIKEMNYLTSKGLIPQVAKAYENADWTDPEVAKQPGVKEQKALLDYMIKENTLRKKSGIAPLTSIVDAYNAWKLDTTEKQVATERKKAGEARKAAGARVSGVSPSSQNVSNAPKGIAVGKVMPQRGAAMWDD